MGKLQKEGIFPYFDIPEIDIEIPQDKSQGDYATSIAMRISKITKKKPIETAQILTSALNTQDLKMFSKIETAQPGFINFFLSKEYLQNQVSQILKEKQKYGNLKIGQNKKIQVEFISANPTGPLTIANARGGPLGDVLGNVLKKAGFSVEKAYYINDYGMQILALGHSVLKDGKAQYKGDYIDYLHKTIKEKDPYRVGEKAAQIIVNKWIKKTTDRLGIKYDSWDSENNFHKKGIVDETIKFLKKKGLVYEKEGATWFKSSQFGDGRDRVVIKADGTKTYLAGDIAHHRYKFEKKKFDKVINIWGADHHGDVPGLMAAAEALGHKGKLDIILTQFVSLFKKGKKIRMSKRAGTYITIDQLLDEVGLDVVRFFFLQRSSGTHLNFDLDLAKEQSEKNPVYYVQYAHARICSILQKSEVKSQQSKVKLNHSSELGLVKQLIRFPEIIEDAALDYQVQRLPQYALDVATLFHRFYHDCPVLTQNQDIKQMRIALILAAQTVLKEIFGLMGISAPAKM